MIVGLVGVRVVHRHRIDRPALLTNALSVEPLVVLGPDAQKADIVRLVIRLGQGAVHHIPALYHLQGGPPTQDRDARFRKLPLYRPDRRCEHHHIADALIHHDQNAFILLLHLGPVLLLLALSQHRVRLLEIRTDP